MRLGTLRAATAACLLVGALCAPGVEAASLDRPWFRVSDGSTSGGADPFVGRSAFSQFAVEDPPSDPRGLPAARENFDVISQFSPTHPEFGKVQLGQIADLSVHDGYAYLNSWDDPDCKRGGTFVVDIRDPAAPKQVGFIKSTFPYYHGEGAHAVSIKTPQFDGDILAVNDETYGSNVDLNPVPTCDFDGDPATDNDFTGGGFDLYDVSDPANPKPLVQGAGDNTTDPTDPTEVPRAKANSYHSVFVWQAGPRAYLVASDNVEFTDVDVFDITDPKAPEFIGDYDLLDLFPQINEGEQANGGLILHHDMVVKQIEGKFILKSDYWDAGYVQLDVTDPKAPKYVTDTRYAGEDPLLPGSGLTPEGNAHQGEFSADNQFILAADEDFGYERFILKSTSGPTAGRAGAAAEGDAVARVADLPDGKMNGPSVFVGDACNVATIPAAPADDGNLNTDDIALIERGVCDFSVKFDNAQAKGWDALVVFNQVRPDDGRVNMLTGAGGIPGVHMRRVDAIGSAGVLSAGPATPPPGTAGPTLESGIRFDGWGYAHLYDARTSQLIDSYAIQEGLDPRFSPDFGDLSIHEFATDPTEPVAYSSYYAGGLRAFQFSRANGLVPTAKFIAEGGSNFWGVEQFTTPEGQRLVAGSDRDFGLVILRYTGPGAPQRPSCADTAASTGPGAPVEVALTCSDPNTGNTLTRSIVSPPANGTLGNVADGKVVYTPNAGFAGEDTFTFKARDGAADSNVATAKVTVAAPPAPSPTPTATPTATPTEPPNVIRVQPGLTATVRPKRDRRLPYTFTTRGALRLPSGVSRSAGCRGRVRITVRREGTARVLASPLVSVRSSCAFGNRMTFRRGLRLGARGTLRFTIRFQGNSRLLPRTITRTATYGRG